MQLTGILSAIVVALGVIAGLLGTFTGSLVTAPPADVSLGAIPGNEVQGNEFIIGNSKLIVEKKEFSNVASTTLCSFRLPTATSTLVSASVKLAGNSNGTDLIMARGTDTNAQTTVLARRGGAAGFTGDLVATSTPNLLTSANWGTLPANQYINVGLTSATAATGTCSIMLQVL